MNGKLQQKPQKNYNSSALRSHLPLFGIKNISHFGMMNKYSGVQRKVRS